ncbi:MAG: hypothetical protein ABR607_14905 [Pyrinomonadaceae bacterium]
MQDLSTDSKPDPRISYPCYKSLDDFIDLARLKGLDGYITERIEKHICAGTDDLFLNEHTLSPRMPYQPGAREVWLTRTIPGTPYNYQDLNKTHLWRLTEAATEFSELMAFIETLPFQSRGRILIIYDDRGTAVPAHRDHLETEICHEFIWFRTNLRKPFFMYSQGTAEKLYVKSYSAWFDTVNQFHGSDVMKGLSFSIRVDGIFTDEFRKLIPHPAFNIASTPALWAAASSPR